VGGLERSLHLAESLAARGLTSGDPASHAVADTVALLLGLAAALLGWLLPVVGLLPQRAGVALLVTGGAVAIGALLRRGRRMPHTDFRPAPWRWSDTLVALAAWAPVALAAAGMDGRAALAWLPYPALELPPAPVSPVLALAGLALPAVVLGTVGRRVRHAAPAAP
jgi:energy-coupling factor transport system permease protein